MTTPRQDNSTPGTPEAIVESGGESASEAVHDTVVEMGPWMVSLMAHLGVIILALFLVWSTMVAQPDEPVGPVSVEMKRPVNEELLKSDDKPLIDHNKAQRNPKSEPVATTQPDFRVIKNSPLEHVGVGPQTNPIKAIFTAPTPGDDGLFEDPGKGRGEFGPAKRIVFVIDASGSVIDGFDFVINELRRTIHKLDEDQSFSVVFFQHGFALEAAPGGSKGRGMHKATWERKVAVCDWITTSSGHITPSGSSDPRPALTRAFAYKPDLVYILSDNITGRGVYQLDRDDLLKDISTLNVTRSGDPRATIHTIQFLYPDPLDTLEAISKRTKGTHRFVRESDLVGPRPKGPGA